MATASGTPPPAMDEKARRTRDLLASFYNTNPSAAAAAGAAVPASLARPSPAAAPASPLDSINSTSFDPETYMNVLVQQSNLEGLLQRHVKMAAEIKNLDTDLQMLVYENYNKFISATDTIKRMKTNIVGMEANMEQLLSKAYGDTSFQDCKKASEEAMDLVVQHLQAKLYSDSEPIEARAEAVVLLKQLNFPVDNLKSNLLEKLEDCLLNLQNEPTQASISDISKTFRAYLIIFPDSERRLIELAQALFSNRYETVRENLKKRIPSTDLLAMLHALVRAHSTTNEKLEESQLQTAMDTSKIKVSQGCIDLLQEFHHLIDGNTELLVKLRDLIIDWVQEGFQDFFQKLDGHFHVLSGRSKSFRQESSALDPVQIDKVPTVLVLMLAQLCVYIEQTTIPKVTEYINMKTQKISKLLNKRFTTPVWIKHKEPREVNMFVDLLLLEESVISMVLKLCLKSLQEFVRLQTFNRSGFQQIQLDMEFLKSSLKEFVDDEAAISFLLKEVNNAAHERCLDPIPLEPPILDKLINAKLAKIKEQNPNMQ
ncbi:hypothetical protein BAE44_0014344 [Dichanthelium oligosanthes]|uniref:Vacuolar protein sorting-associated protein 51 homolog n=1 Tax=Dichanthelium oligosanthes TaxID=888268 RepID=A0A1E5VHT6_9POAL|nr:hypothetical protein BAE44_0014344 [Dichanthelium oligosanthes]